MSRSVWLGFAIGATGVVTVASDVRTAMAECDSLEDLPIEWRHDGLDSYSGHLPSTGTRTRRAYTVDRYPVTESS